MQKVQAGQKKEKSSTICKRGKMNNRFNFWEKTNN